MTIYCKVHRIQNKTILAAADDELIGKTISQDETGFLVSEKFYKEKKISTAELIELIEQADSVNLVGKQCVSAGIASGWIKKEDTIIIGSIPHAQLFKI